jgi:hypothetical protein
MVSARLAELLGGVIALEGSLLGGFVVARAMVRRLPDVTLASALRHARYL